ncbi:MAG: tetratricopeptide repeat protein [Anaerolineae bacterium]|nr:tetratricopeptide repeat protein [Anaerolineae bacterium]MCI0609400.1 tetratricopeptide repeat protein [Anaerolineae bacterium]
MSKRKTILLLSFVIIILVVSNLSGVFFNSSPYLPDPEDIDGSTLATIPSVDVAIKTVQNKIKQNPKDAVSYTLLGDLYIRQARETGDVSGYQRAETALNQALEILPGYSPAGSLLASVYYAQHEFAKALTLAEKVYESNTKNSQVRIVIADSYLSLGNYEDAEVIYKEIGETNVTPPLLARLAHLAELKGNSDEALTLIQRAAGEALNSGGTKESVAWYLLRVGDMYFNTGEIREAGAYYEASLRVFDNYHLALAGLGKVRAAQGKYDQAIGYYQHAINIVPQPDFLAALGDIYMLTGQTDEAKIQYETVEYIGKLAAINQQIYNRQLANFYSDHDMHLDEALDLALTELESRKDIYGYDSAAWAYYKNGNYKDAQHMMDQAMALGTRDALLFYHAGMIAHALGDNQQARNHLHQALTINPYFSILYSEEARKTLDALQSQAGG